jgi:hypothetical protein
MMVACVFLKLVIAGVILGVVQFQRNWGNLLVA